MAKFSPLCPNCGQSYLEIEDVIDTYTNYEGCQYTELTIGTCPHCNHTYQYEQTFTLKPNKVKELEDIAEDEEDEEYDS